ncbi:hypothetical protein UlMin_018009 [Ulmus minor]
MTLTTRSAFILLHLFLFSLLLGTYKVSHATETDIFCLKSIKETFEDPLNALNSWNFVNNTEGFICKFVGVECWQPDENKVLNLRLSGIGLEGKFPRGIANCTALTGLNLSNNQLSGTIPSDIGALLPYVTSLDLSNNKFSGEIPKSLSNCAYLNVLKLDHNQLSGSLPMELGLLHRIKSFSVANNQLSGELPHSYTNITEGNYANNPGLCGGPLEPCQHKKDPFKNSFKFGFGTGYLVSVIAVLLCCYVPCLQLKTPTMIMVLSMLEKKDKRDEANRLIPLSTLEHKKQIIPGFERLVNKISFTQLRRATNNFSEDNVIGVGKTGTVYRATLPNGSFLAVRRLHDSQEDQSQLVSELLTLARLKHDNLIPLLGFCLQNNERLLVYKYMSNGNLMDWLNTVQGEAKILEWPLRVKIAIGIARGLAWIHHECDFKVVHRNISSTCILLDQYFEPRISNFHKAIMSNHGGAMFAYLNEDDSGFLMNSEMWETGFVKEDVYNFGVVLVDLITGKESNCSVSSSSSSLHTTLVEWINDDVTNHVIDKSLISQGFDGEILQVLRIASECVQPVPCQRPTMLQVYNSIRNLGDRYNISFDSGSASGGEIVEIQ